MSAVELRDYQQADLARLRDSFAAGARRVLYQAPTGSGKTVLFATVVAGAVERGNRIVILAHRQEIVDQIGEALGALEVAGGYGLIAAGETETPDRPVQIASVATLARRLDRLSVFDFIVVDEAHHAAAKTWRRIIGALPEARLLGVTATPQRLDGRGLDDIFDELVVGPAIGDLIEAGFLCPFAAYGPARLADLSRVHIRAGDYAVDELAEAMSDGVVIRSAVDEYTRLCPGSPAIAFCVDIEHSERVARAFAERGFRSAHVDGNTPREVRRDLIAALGDGRLAVLCNCGIISEGLDVPAVAAAILLRPTKSLTLHLQQIGRALRPAPGKARALILDHAGNTHRLGFPDEPRDWSLAGRTGRRPAPPVRRCPACGALNYLSARQCGECGHSFAAERARREHAERTGDKLREIDRLAAMSYPKALRWAGADEKRLRLIAQARGYKAGWVWHRIRELSGGAP